MGEERLCEDTDLQQHRIFVYMYCATVWGLHGAIHRSSRHSFGQLHIDVLWDLTYTLSTQVTLEKSTNEISCFGCILGGLVMIPVGICELCIYYAR